MLSDLRPEIEHQVREITIGPPNIVREIVDLILEHRALEAEAISVTCQECSKGERNTYGRTLKGIAKTVGDHARELRAMKR